MSAMSVMSARTRVAPLAVAGALATALTSAGCVDEYDPEVWVVLPRVTDACATLGVGQLAVDVTTREGERFVVRTRACEARLAGQDIAGFQLQLERVTYGYHRLEARLEDADGLPLGSVSRPFAATVAPIVAFERADVPGWPQVEIGLDIPACGAGAATVALIATVPDQVRPVLDATLPCGGGPMVVTVPRGPLAVTAHAGAACGAARAELYADDGAHVTLAAGEGCP